MNLHFKRILWISTFILFQQFGLQANQITIPFYSEQIKIQFDANILLNIDTRYNEKNIVSYFKKMESTPYQSLLSNLKVYKRKLGLNDWFYYELLNKTVAKIYSNKSDLQKTLSAWFLLTKAGFNTRLTYINTKAFVYVYSEDGVFEVPMIEEKGKNFVNLTSIQNGTKNYSEAVYLLNFVPNPRGRSFGFKIKKLPQLKPNLNHKKIRFSKGEKNYLLEIQLDNNVVEMMKRYPIIDEQQYFEVPLSPTITQSLLPKLRKIIAGKNQKEALELLVSFTRSGFKYKEDHEFFGKSKPMIADEVFYYPFSDCEDRSALFYTLVKELLDLPMIIIAYSDHLTIAVATKEAIGKAINFQGRAFYICDPTGPNNSTKIGEAPKEYAKSAYEILGFYN